MAARAVRDLSAEVSELLGVRVTSLDPVHGGDVSEAFRARFADGRSAFVKTASPEEAVEAEAFGLGWLADAGAIATPRVLAVRSGVLVLDWVETGNATRASEVALGRGLAALHRASPARFGLDRPGWLAGIPWDNDETSSWGSFYAERRLLPLLEQAARRRRVTPAIERGIRSVAMRIDSLVGPPEPPARLHGDLWGGNVLFDQNAAPVLIDPAPYGGHREIDLAMMRLFGGFSSWTFDAYAEAHPLAPGHEARVPLYQLLPLLAHVVLFGGSYVGQLERALRAVE